jgi:hypothetical protein
MFLKGVEKNINSVVKNVEVRNILCSWWWLWSIRFPTVKSIRIGFLKEIKWQENLLSSRCLMTMSVIFSNISNKRVSMA